MLQKGCAVLLGALPCERICSRSARVGSLTHEYRVSRGSVSIFESAISPNAFHHAPDRCPSILCPETNLLVYSGRSPTKDNRVKLDITAPLELPSEIRDALPVDVRFVAEPNVTVGDRTSYLLSNANL